MYIMWENVSPRCHFYVSFYMSMVKKIDFFFLEVGLGVYICI